jgi:hypothetical protein
MVRCRAIRSPRRRGSLTFIGSRSQPGSSARCAADYTIWGRTLLTLEGHTQVVAGQTVDPVNFDPPGTIRHLGLPLLHVGTTGLPLPGGVGLGQAKRSEEIAWHPANQWQPAQVAIKPGGTVRFRIAGGQTHPVGSGQAPPEDKRFDASKCQPAHDQASLASSAALPYTPADWPQPAQLWPLPPRQPVCLGMSTPAPTAIPTHATHLPLPAGRRHHRW